MGVGNYGAWSASDAKVVENDEVPFWLNVSSNNKGLSREYIRGETVKRAEKRTLRRGMTGSPTIRKAATW